MNDQYEITKTINNNISFSKDENGTEIIIIGKGISFGKKRGDFVNACLVDKTFQFQNRDEKKQFDFLLSTISTEYIEISTQIVKLFEDRLNVKLNPIIYINLSDHIANAITLNKEGIHVPNALSNEIKRIYPIEHSIAVSSLNLIEEYTGQKLHEDEASFITTHVINSYGSYQTIHIKKKIAFIDSIVNIIKKYFDINTNHDNFYYQRFMTHMNYFSHMILENGEMRINNDFVYIALKKNFPQINICIDEISSYIKNKYKRSITDEEKGYLMIHINALIKKEKQIGGHL